MFVKKNPGILAEHKFYVKNMWKSYALEIILARINMSDINRFLIQNCQFYLKETTFSNPFPPIQCCEMIGLFPDWQIFDDFVCFNVEDTIEHFVTSSVSWMMSCSNIDSGGRGYKNDQFYLKETTFYALHIKTKHWYMYACQLLLVQPGAQKWTKNTIFYSFKNS